MNLIEQLGGYDEAKEVLEKIKSRDHKYAQKFEKPALEQALLQYRREHNIFEVGDKVVLKSSRFGTHHDSVYTVKHINAIHRLFELCCGWCGFSHSLQHATDEEIKAGRIL